MSRGNTDEEKAPTLSGVKKILVAYFSHSGNTREIANQIQGIVGGDIFRIEAVKSYPDEHDAVVERAGQELHSGYRPALTARVENIKPYDLRRKRRARCLSGCGKSESPNRESNTT